MSEFNSIDDFLSHGTGGRGKYLKNWKKDGKITVWLHKHRFPMAVVEHSLPRLVVYKDKKSGEQIKSFWNRDHKCAESEDYLFQQYKRGADGRLVNGPNKCAICKLIDVVTRKIEAGQLSITDPIFKFEGSSDGKSDKVFHAGGLTNRFSNKDISQAEKAAMKAAKIYQKDAWTESMRPSMKYVFAIVNHNAPSDGVQIAKQPKSIGDKVKSVIRDRIDDLGKVKGDPSVTPYAFQLVYDAAEGIPFDKKYHARRMESAELSAEIERLIEEDPPSFEEFKKPYNQKELRAFWERYAVADLPWDEIFEIDAHDDSGPLPEDPGYPESWDEVDAETEDRAEQAAVAKPATRTMKVPEPRKSEPKLPDNAVATIPCDKCGHPMLETESKCPKCGTEYDLDDDSVPPPPPKKVGKTTGDKVPFNKF